MEAKRNIIEFQFSLGDKVRIIEIGRDGIIKSLIVDNLGIQYLIHYWDNCERKTTWLHAEDIKNI